MRSLDYYNTNVGWSGHGVTVLNPSYWGSRGIPMGLIDFQDYGNSLGNYYNLHQYAMIALAPQNRSKSNISWDIVSRNRNYSKHPVSSPWGGGELCNDTKWKPVLAQACEMRWSDWFCLQLTGKPDIHELRPVVMASVLFKLPFYLFTYSFIFGCTGLVAVHGLSPAVVSRNCSRCGVRASHCGGFPCRGAQALGTRAPVIAARRF